jgi:hypothetical protein
VTFRAYSRRNALIGQILTIPVAHVSQDHIFGYEMGHLESGACSPLWLGHYLRDREPVLSVAPFTIWPVPGGAFPDDEQWPADVGDLITQMGSGEW